MKEREMTKSELKLRNPPTRMNAPHPWKLVAPWYRWQRQFDAESRKPSQTRPVFQKFDQTDFVKSFNRDPQRSLRFFDQVDTVYQTLLNPVAALGSGPLKDRFTRLYAPKQGGKTSVAQDATLVPTGTRKLYLPIHKRFYLVVCELHCDMPGFPTTTPDQVCQAGFVVRRRSFNIPETGRDDAAKILEEITRAQAEIAYWTQTSPARGTKAKRRADAVQKAISDGTYELKLSDARAQLTTARQALSKWRDLHGVAPMLEGWFPSPLEGIGAWQDVAPAPTELIEAAFPLYALFPNPSIPHHSARGKNIYFGVVPTSSLDTDSLGNPRFDHQATYEIRCFVRRHKAECPRLNEQPDCPGELVWSEPTEPFKIAPPADLIGTSQRPVTIQLPDLTELAAQAMAFPAEKFAPVRVVQPQGLSFDVDDGKAKKGGVGGFQICFFAIPLITLVAFFVLKLFLPILVFLFGLFFLLQLKFCIPPSVKIDAGLNAELDVIPPSFDANAAIDAQVNVQFNGNVVNVAALNASLRKVIADDSGIIAPDDHKALEPFSNVALLPLGRAIKRADSLEKADPLTQPVGPDFTASLEFEPRVEAKLA
jgi:hypothetical protein